MEPHALTLGVLGRIEWWDKAIIQTSSLMRSLGKKVIEFQRYSISTLRDELSQLSLKLEANPFFTNFQNQVAQIKQELRKVEVYEAKGAQIKSHL